MTDVLLTELKMIANLKVGDPMPETLGPVAWGETISKLCGNAAAEIIRLRAQVVDLTRIAGVVDVPLKTFDDIKRTSKAVSDGLATLQNIQAQMAYILDRNNSIEDIKRAKKSPPWCRTGLEEPNND